MSLDYVALFGTVGRVSGKDKLLHLAKGDDLVKDILYYTYEPLLKFYIKKLPWEGKGSLTLRDTEDIWKSLLDRSAERQLSGHQQQAEFAQFIKCLTPGDAELFKNMVVKDLKVGIAAKSINSVFDGLIPEFGFMKAHPYDERRLVNKSYMSLKIDCIRAMLRGGVLYSSGGRIIPGVQHIAKQLNKRLELDGELTIPGLDFNAASGRIRSNDECPTAVFNVFDVPSNSGPFHHRYAELVEHAQYWPDNVSLVKHLIATGPDHVQRNFVRALDAGFEGLVIKSPNHKYQLKRSWDWMKLKAEDPEEVRIVGFNEGTGKYVGSLGSVRCIRDNGVEVDVSGFTDELKHHIWNNQELWLDEIIEINFHEETPDGSLRHPRFAPGRDAKVHRHRWDKSGKPLASWPKETK